MRHPPPEDLVSLLDRLRLATPKQVAVAERRARRLARGLPLFTSVWIDALVKDRRLTPYQAAEINAGRGERLRVGPYVLFRKLNGLGFADVHEARHIETGEACRLATFSVPADQVETTVERLKRLVADGCRLPRDVLALVDAFGHDGADFWAACDAAAGCTAAEAIVYKGRFPPDTVLEIARAMMPGLVALETAGLCHGDLRAATLLLTGDAGRCVPRLPFAGLRGTIRMHEGYARADLSPEAFDGLAPERVREGTPPEVRADVYACGCLWWHLLTGREPLSGGDALTKLQAAENARVADPRPLAPDVPETLSAAIGACTRPVADQRPAGMGELSALLGPASLHAPRRLRRSLARHVGLVPLSSTSAGRLARRTIAWFAGIAVGLVLVVGLLATVPSPWRAMAGRSAPTDRLATRPEPDTRLLTTPEPASPDADVDRRPEKPTPPPAVVDAPPPAEPSGPPDLVLPVDGPDAAAPVDRLPLVAGQRVHGPPDRRVTLNVARQGLLVDVPDVVFENVDFVRPSAAESPASETAPAILRLQTARVVLRGCTFRSVDPSVDAVRWVHPVGYDASALSLPSGQIVVDRCIFRDVDTAVDSHARGAVAIHCDNVLHLGTGPLVHFARPPGADEPRVISLRRTTLRRCGPLIQCDTTIDGPTGRISITTDDCVFAPREDQPLVVITGQPVSDSLLGKIVWSGQGSLVTSGSPMVGRLEASGTGTVLPENVLAIEGLVRSEVEFADEPDGTAAASQAVRWLAPLHSDKAPGIDAARLAP